MFDALPPLSPSPPPPSYSPAYFRRRYEELWLPARLRAVYEVRVGPATDRCGLPERAPGQGGSVSMEVLRWWLFGLWLPARLRAVYEVRPGGGGSARPLCPSVRLR